MTGPKISDEQAMWRVQTQGDHRAFALLVERWETPIRRLCIRMINDEHRGEDVKQEVFARVYQKRNGYRATAKFSTWLWRIALNLCYDELRRFRRRNEVEPLEDSEDENIHQFCDRDGAFQPESMLVAKEEAALVRNALASLPDIYRTVLILRHYEDLKLREIAEVLEIPRGTVNSRLAEALSRLSRLLEPQLNSSSQPSQKQTLPKPIISTL